MHFFSVLCMRVSFSFFEKQNLNQSSQFKFIYLFSFIYIHCFELKNNFLHYCLIVILMLTNCSTFEQQFLFCGCQ
jgi:hypothetical protein